MSKINLTREIKGTSKLSTKKEKMCITYVSICIFNPICFINVQEVGASLGLIP